MQVSIFENYDQLSKHASQLIINQIITKPDSLLCFAAGHTPKLTYQYLSKENPLLFSQCHFIGLDEWGGMNGKHEGSCRHFLNSHVFSPLAIHQTSIHFFDGCLDLDHECHIMNDFLTKNGPIDFMTLGLGMNGHLGFNEPFTPFNALSHVVKLEGITKNVGQKYFSEKLELDLGLTLGLKQILETKQVILLVNGRKKAEIVKTALTGPVTDEIPATLLQIHPNVELLLDQEAAALLNGGE